MTHEQKNLVASVEATKTRQTTLVVDYVTADIIGVTYDMMPGARPADAGSVIAIWQNAEQIAWDDPPLKTQSIGAQQHGSVAFDGLSVQSNSYVIGLTTGPMKTDPQKARNAAAQAWIPGVDPPPVLNADFLTLKFVGPTSVAAQFNCLPGYRAATDLAWLGLWRGESASYSKPPDVGAIPIKIDSNFGTSAFNDVSIGVGLPYTIGFFTSGWSDNPANRIQSVLACSLTFTQGALRT